MCVQRAGMARKVLTPTLLPARTKRALAHAPEHLRSLPLRARYRISAATDDLQRIEGHMSLPFRSIWKYLLVVQRKSPFLDGIAIAESQRVTK